MHRNASAGPARLYPPTLTVAVDEEVGDILLLADIGNLQPPQFLQPRSSEQRKQRKPLRGLSSPARRALALGEDLR